ncbi:MAG: hypothetical protein GX171_01940 [Clostridiales bacterium]|jgi:transcriptional regulator with XRE-family HTH domain|nr:hypothetical protein [Clostridiales bacterium]
METSLQALRAALNLSGLSRKEIAARLYLSHSALNRKLRGEISFTQREKEHIFSLAQQGREKAL